jgi:hypothetical protein
MNRSLGAELLIKLENRRIPILIADRPAHRNDNQCIRDVYANHRLSPARRDAPDIVLL